MNSFLPHLLPLLAAMFYVLGALLVKRANGFGVGVWRTTFVSNVTSAVIFQLALPLGGTFQMELIWQPALVGLVFFGGQVFNFLALQRGDVSVATPVLGAKIILVALFTTVLLTQGVTPKLWAAAALSSVAIALLNRNRGARHHHVGATILLAGMSALLFALFDVLVQKWAPAWGAGRFLPVMLGCVGLYSAALVPLFREPLTAVPRGAWPWLLGGCTIFGFQSLTFVFTVAHFRNVTAANVMYSSRGLWSVVAVWAVGHWFANREQQLGAEVLGWRLAGAVLMMVAIVLVLV